jgi:hypothetical protein
MDIAHLEAELARKLALLQASLGRVLWRLHIPQIDSRPFMMAQRIAAAQLREKAHKRILVLKVMLWIVTFGASLYIFQNYKGDFHKEIAIGVSIIIAAFCLFLFGNARAIYKALYEMRGDMPCDFLFGEEGVLLVSDSDIQLFPWDSIVSCLKDKHAHYLVVKHTTILILPQAVLAQHPDADALIAFIDNKMVRSSSS